MRLLVSVADAADAQAAIEGGADVIDAKDPRQGALGAVGESRLSEIVAAVASVRPISVALGEIGADGAPRADGARHEGSAIERLAAAAATSGVDYVKLAFAPGVSVTEAERSAGRVMAVVAGACKVVLATYADGTDGRLDPYAVVDMAARSGATGVLLDTLDKRGVGLFEVLSSAAVALWVETAHAAHLLVAVAGSLRGADLTVASGVGADLVGVRGAVCAGGRTGRVSASRVRALVAALRSNEAMRRATVDSRRGSGASAHPDTEPKKGRKGQWQSATGARTA
jgi:(5-formylfuran-3-yl)methyl phosphate synthase